MTHEAKAPMISIRAWNRIILFLWLGLITMAQAQAVWKDYAPTTRWLDVRSIYVNDAEEGSCPTMEVDRTIVRPFLGHLDATVFKLHSYGSVVFPPSGSGTVSHVPHTVLPQPLYLAWWMYWPRCDYLTPGRYYVRTVWTIMAHGFPRKYVTVDSNVFTISPEER